MQEAREVHLGVYAHIMDMVKQAIHTSLIFLAFKTLVSWMKDDCKVLRNTKQSLENMVGFWEKEIKALLNKQDIDKHVKPMEKYLTKIHEVLDGLLTQRDINFEMVHHIRHEWYMQSSVSNCSKSPGRLRVRFRPRTRPLQWVLPHKNPDCCNRASFTTKNLACLHDKVGSN